jgi:hypothetical protein
MTTIMPARAKRGFEVQFQVAGWLKGGRTAGCDKSGIDSKTVAARGPGAADDGEACSGDSMGLVKDPSLDTDGRDAPTREDAGALTPQAIHGARGQQRRRRNVIGSARTALEP